MKHNWPWVLMWSLRSLSVAKRLKQCEHWNLWPMWHDTDCSIIKGFFNITKLNFINLTESTFHGALSYDVVKQLCIVGIHPPTAGTCHHLFLSVAAQVLSQLRTAFSSRFTVWKWQAQNLDSKVWNPQLDTENVQLYNLHLTFTVEKTNKHWKRTFPSTAYRDFTVSCRYLYAQAVHFHMAIKPLRVFIRWLL